MLQSDNHKNRSFTFIPAEPWDLTIPGLVYDRLRSRFSLKQAFKFLESEAVVEEYEVRQEFRMTDRMRFLIQEAFEASITDRLREFFNA